VPLQELATGLVLIAARQPDPLAGKRQVRLTVVEVSLQPATDEFSEVFPQF
jgi:hypothetical protein